MPGGNTGLDGQAYPNEMPGNIVHRAGWVMIDPQTVFANGYMREVDGRIVEIGAGKSRESGEVIDYGSGVIMPSLVNAHTHLELSALQGKLDGTSGFESWVRKLLQLRGQAGNTKLLKAASKAAMDLPAEGCRVVGEISSLGLTADLVLRSDMAGVWFHEALGQTVDLPAEAKRSANKVASLACHAPHTTAPAVLKAAKNFTRAHRLPFSIHLAESEAEVDFLANGTGRWAEFLRERGIDFSDWHLSGKSPVQYLDDLGILDGRTLAVHLLHANARDLETLTQRNVNVCLCLRSNLNLHGRLPDIKALLKAGLTICLGTDSLASTESLSLFDEMRFVSTSNPWLSPERILEMATRNGRKALGLSEYSGNFMYVPVSAAGRRELLSALTHGEKEGACRIIRTPLHWH